jgi:hypothetical protein
VEVSNNRERINKLNKYQQLTTKFIDTAGENGFYHSPQNQVRLVESKTRIAVANKLIVWLGGDKSIAFNADEKALLSHGCAVVSILENAGIHLDELPFHDSETEYGSKAL